MARVAFKMKLLKGHEAEYKRRHDALWPELRDLLKSAGISRYSIFLDEPTGYLFASMEIDDASKLSALPQQPVMQSWWKAMSDIMETNPDHSPVSIPLPEVFYLP